jgi:hypothetical protein
MKSLNRRCHLTVLALVLAAMPAMAAQTPTAVLDLHQKWLDGTDSFLADVLIVAVDGVDERLVAKGLLLSDQRTGDLSFSLEQFCPYLDDPFQAERLGGRGRVGIAGIGYSDIPLRSGPFKNGSWELFSRGSGSWDVFSRGSTAAQSLERLGVIADDVRAVEGTGMLAGLEGLVVSFDQGFKRSYQGVVEKILGGELTSDDAWNDPQQLEMWFDAEDGRIHQISSIGPASASGFGTLVPPPQSACGDCHSCFSDPSDKVEAPPVRYDILFDYLAVDLSPAELAETREAMAIQTSDQPYVPSLKGLIEAYVGARPAPVAMRAGLPLVAGILLFLVGGTLRRLS